MDRIIIKSEPESFISKKKTKRGAKVYGIPMSRELASYIDDVAPDAQQQRLLNMFFAGKYIPVSLDDEDEE